MSNDDIPAAHRELYQYMMENDADAYPGDGDLAERLGYTKRTLSNAISNLKQLGYIVPSHVGRYGRHYHTIADEAPRELPRPDRPEWQTEAWLRDKYVREGLTQQEVANMAGVSQGSIGEYIRSHGIKTTNKRTDNVIVCCELGNRFRSRWEHEVAHRLEEADVDWKHEPYRIEAGGRTYLPDFVCGDTIIEIKGRVYEENDQDLALEALMTDGHRVVVVGGSEAESLPHDEFINYDGGRCEGLIAALDD